MSTRPKIDINEGKFEFIKFIRDNKLSIPITEGGKRRGVKALKEDLEKGGYLIGVKGKSKAPKSRGEKPKQSGLKEKQIQQQQQYAKLTQQFPEGFSAKNVNVIKLSGFSATNVPPAQPVSPIQVEYSGYGGIPITTQLTGYEREPTPSEMRDYLTSRVPVDDFRYLTKPALKELYDKVRSGEDKTDYSKGVPMRDMKEYLSGIGVPNTVFKDMKKSELRELFNKYKQGAEAQSQLADEPVSEAAVADEEPQQTEEFEGELITYEGITYQFLEDEPDEIYNLSGDFVGKFDVDFIDIEFINDQFKNQHEADLEDLEVGDYEEPERKKIKRKKPAAEPEPEEEDEVPFELRRYRERKEAAKKRKEEREKERIANLDEEDVDELLGLLDVETYGYQVAMNAYRDLTAFGLKITEPKRRLDSMTPFKYEGITYYIDSNEDFEMNPKVFNDKLEVVGSVGSKSSRKYYVGGGNYENEYNVRFKVGYRDIHDTLKD
jgi:hypothetical protein